MTLLPVEKLPKIGWFGLEALDPARVEPIEAIPYEISSAHTKPRGGLWTAPVIRAGRAGQIIGTNWSVQSGSRPITIVKPHKLTRVVQVDNKADLAAVVARWPDKRSPIPEVLSATPAGYHRDDFGRLVRGELKPTRIDWPAMAADVDAFYLTQAGVGQLNLPHDQLHLWGWDVPTVLFLNPTFSPGKHITPPPAEVVREMHVQKFRRDMNAMVAAGRITEQQRAEAVTFYADILMDNA